MVSKKVEFERADKDRKSFCMLRHLYTLADMNLPVQTVHSRKVTKSWTRFRNIDSQNKQKWLAETSNRGRRLKCNC